MNDSIRVRVSRRTRLSESIVGIELVSMDGNALPAFEAGAHIDVQTPGGPIRQYSLCNAPDDRTRYEIGVLRDPASRGGSIAMHDRLAEGDCLTIGAPRQHFPLDEGAPWTLLLAGGIGITPLLSMCERLHRLDRPFVLHYATRSRPVTAYIDRIAKSGYAGKVHLHHDDGPAEQQLQLARVLADPLAGARTYVCGPLPFIEAVRQHAATAGWPATAVRFEYFAGPGVQGDSHGDFEVIIRSTGAVVPVGAAQTVVEALEAAGIYIPVSCGEGVCGSCLTGVLNGEVDHRDVFLSPAQQRANDQFTPCCSRARSARLVLDL